MRTIVIGVGRRGGDCVSKLSLPPTDSIELLYADTDIDDLELRPRASRLHLGAGIQIEDFERNNPSFSFRATMDERRTIEDKLSGADIVVLVAGLGGGTGAGGSRALAMIAKELGIPVAAVVTRPFSVEGEERLARGRRGARELEDVVDFFVPFYQDQVVSFAEKGTRVRDLIAVVDEVICHAVEGVVDISSRGLSPSERGGLGPLKGRGLFSYGISEDPKGAVEAAKFAFHGPFLEGVPLSKTEHLVITIRSRDKVPSTEVDRAVQSLLRRTSETAPRQVMQRTVPSLDNRVLLRLFLIGRFGDPNPQMGDFFVPGPTG